MTLNERTRTRIMRQAEEGRLTPDDVGRMAARANVKSLVLTHLTTRAGTNDYASWVAQVRQHFGGPVTAAADLMEL